MIEKPFLIGDDANPGVRLFDLIPQIVTLASLTVGENSELQWVVTEGSIVDTPLYQALDAPH